MHQLNLAYLERLGLYLYLLSLPRELIGAFAIDLHRRKHRRHLHNPTGKCRKHSPHLIFIDVLPRIDGIDLGLQVETRRGGPKPDLGYVFLGAVLQLVDTLGGTPCAHHQHSGGKRIKSTGMAHLELSDIQSPLQRSTETFHRIERCPAQRLVDSYDLSRYEIHSFSCHIIAITYRSHPSPRSRLRTRRVFPSSRDSASSCRQRIPPQRQTRILPQEPAYRSASPPHKRAKAYP